MANKIQIRRDTASNWTSSNPTLSQGEQGYETDTGKLKIGDGSTAWTSLGYSFESSGLSNIVEDTTPQLGGDLDVNSKAINFGDSNGTTTNMLTFGDGNDLKIYHHATAGTYITEEGTGNLNFRAGDLRLMNDAGSTTLQSLLSGIRISNSYTLPTSDGTSGQVMTTDGSGAVTFAAASGGGADLYAANPSSATDPTATGTNAVGVGNDAVASGNNSIALGDNATSAGVRSAALMYSHAGGTDSFAAGIANSSSSRGAQAANAVAIGSNAYVQGTEAIGLGYYATIGSSGTRAVALGHSYANGNDSFAAAIDNNTSSYGATLGNSIAMGYQAKAAGTSSVAIGYQAQTTTANEIVLGGTTNQVKISSAYTLPTSDGSANQVLTTDGSGAVTFADAGGGADLYAANPSSATDPTASGANAVAIGTNAQATNTNAVAITRNAVASGSHSFAVGNNAAATGTNAIAIGSNTDAAERSVAIGGAGAQALTTNTTAIGSSSSSQPATIPSGGSGGTIALGGSYATGTDSLAAAIANNTSSYGSTGANSIAIGYQAKATNTYSTSIGSLNNVTAYGAFGAGDANTVSGDYGVAIGRGNTSGATVSSRPNVALGYTNIATGGVALAVGGNSDTQGIWGKMSHAGGRFSVNGDAQNGRFVFRSDTTDATAEAMTTNNNTASTNNQVVLPNNSVYGFTGTVIARENSAQTNDFAVWEIKGGAVRAANAASTTLGSYNINKISESTGAANWSIALSADTTNGAVAITVTGEASHSIRWVATVNTTEVTY
jgi:hypothetical protein